jgi:hypothetical protein
MGTPDLTCSDRRPLRLEGSPVKVQYDKNVPADPTGIFGMMTNEEFLRGYAAAGAVKFDVDVHHADGVTTTRVSRTLPTARMPAVARRFVGPTIDLVEIVAWSMMRADTWHGDAAVDIAVSGRDARFRGRAAIEPGQPGTRYTLAGDVVIKLPLVGGTVEKLAADALLKAVDAQLLAAAQHAAG